MVIGKGTAVSEKKAGVERRLLKHQWWNFHVNTKTDSVLRNTELQVHWIDDYHPSNQFSFDLKALKWMPQAHSNPSLLLLTLRPDAAHVTSFSRLFPRGEFRPTPQQGLSLSVALPWAKEKIKTNRTLISGPRFSLLSCRQKEPSPGRLPQIKASCSPLAASPIRITTTKPAETIIYSFWCGFWSYPTSSTMPPPPTHPPSFTPPLPRPAPPAFSIFYSQGNKVMPASP